MDTNIFCGTFNTVQEASNTDIHVLKESKGRFSRRNIINCDNRKINPDKDFVKGLSIKENLIFRNDELNSYYFNSLKVRVPQNTLIQLRYVYNSTIYNTLNQYSLLLFFRDRAARRKIMVIASEYCIEWKHCWVEGNLDILSVEQYNQLYDIPINKIPFYSTLKEPYEKMEGVEIYEHKKEKLSLEKDTREKINLAEKPSLLIRDF